MQPITPRHYDEYKTKITRTEASAILEFFFGGMKFPVGDLTYNDREFAQALLISAVDSTYLLSWTEKMMSVAMKPPNSVLGAAGSLAFAIIACGYEFFNYATTKDLRELKIYKMVRDALASGYKAAAMNRLASGAPFSW